MYLNDSAGTILSPNYPDNYPNMKDCTWLIAADDPTQLIKLTFNAFSTEGG